MPQNNQAAVFRSGLLPLGPLSSEAKKYSFAPAIQ
jgi:hypothetical protein